MRVVNVDNSRAKSLKLWQIFSNSSMNILLKENLAEEGRGWDENADRAVSSDEIVCDMRF